jgi:phosphatidylglycerophosphate synthase
MSDETRFHGEVNSRLDVLIVDKICQPMLERIPESIHPNTISLITHLLGWASAGLTFVAWQVDRAGRTLALLGAAACMFLAMAGDCLDGMQARRTNRCSKLGELMDHWLDAIATPLTSVGIILALQIPVWVAAPVMVLTALVYNAQLVLYHHTGRFVHAPASGTVSQFGTSLGYVAAAIVFWFFDRHTYWVDKSIAGLGVVAFIVESRLLWFYYVRLKWLVLRHLPSLLLFSAFAVLYATGVIHVLTFLLAIVMASFRLTGSYVLQTIIGRRFNGFDAGIALSIVVIALSHFFLEPYAFRGFRTPDYFGFLSCLYMLGRNLSDFVRHFAEVRAEASVSS